MYTCTIYVNVLSLKLSAYICIIYDNLLAIGLVKTINRCGDDKSMSGLFSVSAKI